MPWHVSEFGVPWALPCLCCCGELLADEPLSSTFATGSPWAGSSHPNSCGWDLSRGSHLGRGLCCWGVPVARGLEPGSVQERVRTAGTGHRGAVPLPFCTPGPGTVLWLLGQPGELRWRAAQLPSPSTAGAGGAGCSLEPPPAACLGAAAAVGAFSGPCQHLQGAWELFGVKSFI